VNFNQEADRDGRIRDPKVAPPLPTATRRPRFEKIRELPKTTRRRLSYVPAEPEVVPVGTAPGSR
jgi:hypothetical protein